MLNHALLVCAALLALGCQRGSSSDQDNSSGSRADKEQASQATTPSDDAYTRDVDRICNAEEKSGALELEEAQRTFHVAQWLGANIETQEGREFLAKLAGEKPKGKVELLTSESSRLGLAQCDLIHTWSGGEKTTL